VRVRLPGQLLHHRSRVLRVFSRVEYRCLDISACEGADIEKFALTHFGSASLARPFVTWMVFYTPIGRMVEFLLGAIAAQAYLTRPNTAGLLERLPRWMTAALILAWTPAPSLLHLRVAGVSASCAAALVALFVLLAVQYRTRIADILSAPLLVKCGEASYSLYLLHWYTMHQWVAPYAYPLGGGGRIALFFVGIAISIALARLVYLLFERPALRWLRRNFRPLKLHIALGVAFIAITCLCFASALQTVQVRRFCAANTQIDCTDLGLAPAPAR
jgi:peptidoglycan/LPS O-acetylase OafA/YrhL